MNWTRDNAINTAATLYYMLEGFGSAAHNELAVDVGHSNVTLQLAEYAAMSEELLAKLEHHDYPGVYDYEVSAPFGKWLYKQFMNDGSLPTLAQAKPVLMQMIAEFFAQGYFSNTGQRETRLHVLIEEMS